MVQNLTDHLMPTEVCLFLAFTLFLGRTYYLVFNLNVAQKHNQANKIVISMGFLLPEHVVPVQQEQYGITK